MPETATPAPTPTPTFTSLQRAAQQRAIAHRERDSLSLALLHLRAELERQPPSPREIRGYASTVQAYAPRQGDQADLLHQVWSTADAAAAAEIAARLDEDVEVLAGAAWWRRRTLEKVEEALRALPVEITDRTPPAVAEALRALLREEDGHGA